MTFMYCNYNTWIGLLLVNCMFFKWLCWSQMLFKLEYFTYFSGRPYTVSIALPGSILDNAQSPELRTYLAGQVCTVLLHIRTFWVWFRFLVPLIALRSFCCKIGQNWHFFHFSKFDKLKFWLVFFLILPVSSLIWICHGHHNYMYVCWLRWVTSNTGVVAL